MFLRSLHGRARGLDDGTLTTPFCSPPISPPMSSTYFHIDTNIPDLHVLTQMKTLFHAPVTRHTAHSTQHTTHNTQHTTHHIRSKTIVPIRIQRERGLGTGSAPVATSTSVRAHTRIHLHTRTHTHTHTYMYMYMYMYMYLSTHKDLRARTIEWRFDCNTNDCRGQRPNHRRHHAHGHEEEKASEASDMRHSPLERPFVRRVHTDFDEIKSHEPEQLLVPWSCQSCTYILLSLLSPSHTLRIHACFFSPLSDF
jgi:hypothetical protein